MTGSLQLECKQKAKRYKFADIKLIRALNDIATEPDDLQKYQEYCCMPEVLD